MQFFLRAWHIFAGIAGHDYAHATALVCRINASGSSLFECEAMSEGDLVQIRQIVQEGVLHNFPVPALEKETYALQSERNQQRTSNPLQKYLSCPLTHFLAELREVSTLC